MTVAERAFERMKRQAIHDVDDGSPEPLARPRSTPLDVKVVRQEDLGFGLARARNPGVRAAAHDMVPQYMVTVRGGTLPRA